MRWRWGTFSLLHLISPLTANRTARWLDDDGSIALCDTAAQAFSAAVPFRKISTSFQTVVLAGPLAFTLASTFKVPGATTLYRVQADGINTPTTIGFKNLSTDTGWDGRIGVINVFQFKWDGTDAWVEVWQEKGTLPSMTTLSLTFPTRAGNTINQAGQVYTAATSAANFDSFMSSAQAIPQGKAGRVTVKTSDIAIVALCDTNVAESFTSNNLDYYAWNASGPVFSGSGGVVVNSGFTTTNPGWLRLTRSSSGTVTAEFSTNGTSWTLFRTFPVTTLAPLWVTSNLSGLSNKSLEVILFEVEP